MSLYAFVGALETGLAFALVALGSYITFRVLDFPDLTVEGSFPLGAAVVARLMVAGVDPWIATFAAMVAGCLAGFATAFLNIKLRIMHILASILTAIALYSINLRIMASPCGTSRRTLEPRPNCPSLQAYLLPSHRRAFDGSRLCERSASSRF